VYRLYYYPNNASLAPHFILKHMAIDYTLRRVEREKEGQKSAEYLRLNPSGRIPVLIDYRINSNGLAIFESAAICIHLCEQHPRFGLIPAFGNEKRSLFFQWMSYLSTTLQTELMLRYYPERHCIGIGAVSEIVSVQNKRISSVLAIIDDALAEQAYLVGDVLSACDYYLFMLALWALPFEKAPLSYQHLGPYLRRLSTLSVVIQTCEFEEIDISAFQS